MLIFKDIKKCFRRKEMSDRMSKEEWISARTNNPDALGKDVWNSYYNNLKELQIRGRAFEVDPKLEANMMGEFLEKYGIDAKNTENKIVNVSIKGIFQNMGCEFEKTLNSQNLETIVQLANNLSGNKKSKDSVSTNSTKTKAR